MNSPVVLTQNLSKTYGSHRGNIKALSNLDLSVEPGEIFGLLGPNGAGKTTLIKLLLGIVKPSSGTAQLMGQSILSSHSRQRVGYLAENHRFPGYLTGRKILEVYGDIGDNGDVTEEKIIAISDRVRMTEWLDTPIRKYSKGMMQRIGLAQALLHDPDIVFLDEPTDGVDPVGRREIRDFLLWLRDQGKTVFLNSHLLSEVERMCTRVAILKKGAMVFDGTLEALTGNGKLFHLRSSQIPDGFSSGQYDLVYKGPSGDSFHNYECRLSETQDLNALIDELRRVDVRLNRIVPEEKSLEDFFIEVVTSDSAEVSK